MKTRIIDKATIHNVDCMEFLKGCKDNQFDLCITSPPYDKLRDYGGIINTWSYKKAKKIIKQLYRVIKEGGVVVWVVGDSVINGSESGSSFKQALFFKKCGFNIHDTMIFEKNSSTFPARKNSDRYTQIFEYMFIFSKGKPKTANLISDKINKWAGYKDYSGRNKKPTPQKSPRTNIWKYTTSTNDKTNHPAVYPEALVTDNLITWGECGDVVLDPFCGSGTTLKICNLLGFSSVGCELNKDYYEAACERIKNASKQVDMFTPYPEETPLQEDLL